MSDYISSDEYIYNLNFISSDKKSNFICALFIITHAAHNISNLMTSTALAIETMKIVNIDRLSSTRASTSLLSLQMRSRPSRMIFSSSAVRSRREKRKKIKRLRFTLNVIVPILITLHPPKSRARTRQMKKISIRMMLTRPLLRSRLNILTMEEQESQNKFRSLPFPSQISRTMLQSKRRARRCQNSLFKKILSHQQLEMILLRTVLTTTTWKGIQPPL